MSRRYFDGDGRRLFAVGDLVTRGDGDVHVVTEVDDSSTITMRCVTEPRIFPGGCQPWCLVDEVETNSAYKYHYADPEIEALEPPLNLPEDIRKGITERLMRNTVISMHLAGLGKTDEEAREAEYKVFKKSFDLYARISGGAAS